MIDLLSLAADPVFRTGTAQVPEASSLTLFALGVLGVVIGRKLASGGSDDD